MKFKEVRDYSVCQTNTDFYNNMVDNGDARLEDLMKRDFKEGMPYLIFRQSERIKLRITT